MPEIRHQQLGGGPELVKSEIHIPDDTDVGTGTYTTVFKAGALPARQAIASVMLNAPSFQVAVTVNPNRDVVVALGRADGSDPRTQRIVRLPAFVGPSQQTVRVEFAGWEIVGVYLNQLALLEVQAH